jgi:hypothetical protein
MVLRKLFFNSESVKEYFPKFSFLNIVEMTKYKTPKKMAPEI